MHALLQERIHAVYRLTPTIVEVVVHAPLAARMFQPGQFYRLQNFETMAKKVTDRTGDHTTLAMEGLALTGAYVDKEQGLLSTIVLEMGGSSDLCAYLEPGEPVILMGPTGTPTHIPDNKTVLLVGGGLGNAVLFSIGKEAKAKGCRVLYVAGYKKAEDRYKVADIEAAADSIIWCCDETTLQSQRPQDKTFHGNIIQALVAYAEGTLGECSIALSDVTHLIAIGSDRMMHAVATARHTLLKPYLNPTHEAIGSINSPMQCMMKEICAQCLQRHVDPITGKESYVYSCFNQDQPLDCVDFQHLHERLKQNGVQEKLTKQWIDRCLMQLELRKKLA
jgi:NAD(P)H-flavin reductase